MKTIGSSLNTHLQGEVLTIAYLWKLVRTDGTTYGFTSYDRPLLYSGVTYVPGDGMLPTSISQKSNFSVDNLDLTGAISSDLLTEDDLISGKWDYASVTIYVVNYKDLSQGHAVALVGTIGNVSTSRSTFRAEVRGLSQPLSQNIGRIVSPMCDAVLGDSRCQVNVASLTTSGTITSVTSSRVFVASALAGATGYYNGGLITFTSGTSSGQAFEVKSFVSGGTITIYHQAFLSITAGDTFTIYPGCNKLLKLQAGTYAGDCKDKFNNVINFQGYPEVPGTKGLIP